MVKPREPNTEQDNHDARAAYDSGLAERLAALLVANWKRRTEKKESPRDVDEVTGEQLP